MILTDPGPGSIFSNSCPSNVLDADQGRDMHVDAKLEILKEICFRSVAEDPDSRALSGADAGLSRAAPRALGHPHACFPP